MYSFVDLHNDQRQREATDVGIPGLSRENIRPAPIDRTGHVQHTRHARACACAGRSSALMHEL